MIHRFLVRRNAEEDALDFLQDRAVELAGRRDGGKLAEEADGAAEEALKAIRIDELAHVFGAPGCRKDEHIAELSGDNISINAIFWSLI